MSFEMRSALHRLKLKCLYSQLIPLTQLLFFACCLPTANTPPPLVASNLLAIQVTATLLPLLSHTVLEVDIDFFCFLVPALFLHSWGRIDLLHLLSFWLIFALKRIFTDLDISHRDPPRMQEQIVKRTPKDQVR